MSSRLQTAAAAAVGTGSGGGQRVVDCHALLVSLLELVNHHQGACGDSVYLTRAFDACLALAVTALGRCAQDMQLANLVCALLNQAAVKLRSVTTAPAVREVRHSVVS